MSRQVAVVAAAALADVRQALEDHGYSGESAEWTHAPVRSTLWPVFVQFRLPVPADVGDAEGWATGVVSALLPDAKAYWIGAEHDVQRGVRELEAQAGWPGEDSVS